MIDEPLYPKKHVKNYNISRVKKLYKEIYNIDIQAIDLGYKGYRYVRYIRYNVIQIQTNEVLLENVKLYGLGKLLDDNGVY